MARTALITGANRGIGQQVARTLAKDGWDVLVGARDRQKGDTAAARLRKETGGRLKGVENVKVHFASSRIEIDHDAERVSVDDLVTAVAKAGYKATPSAF